MQADNINYENYMKIILNKSHNLDTLILDNCNHNKYFIDSISEAIKSKNNLLYFSFSNCRMTNETLKSFLPCFYDTINKDINVENIIKNKRHKKHKKNKKDIEIKEVKLNENPNFHIKGFDLSSNNILYSGIYSLCKALKINKSIEYLNMFHNCIDVMVPDRLSKF